ncbi:MAG: hypothetical protein ACFFAO_21865 [Candidatus Hermodarchaeota archaeon]
MTSNSNFSEKYSESTKLNQKHDMQSLIRILNQIVNALEAFKNNYYKKFNFSKLASHLKIGESNVNELIEFILNFQHMFKTTLNNYELKKMDDGNSIFLIAELKEEDQIQTIKSFNKLVECDKQDAKLISDFIYTFKFIKRGKGFDLDCPNTELLKKLKALKLKHPFLFCRNGNNLIYPSELGLKLGETIISYNKGNKKIDNLKINEYFFKFD